MSDKCPQEWKSRREIPNLEIKDVADQYEQARLILSRQPPGSGVVQPMINVASMAIELYLKCLDAEVIHVPEGKGMPGFLEYAQPRTVGHSFTKIFRGIDEDLRCRMESAYADLKGREFDQDLSMIEDTFVTSRYPYEPEMDQPCIYSQTLASIAGFLQSFVAGLETKEAIEW